MRAYSTREVAGLIGGSQHHVRAAVRAGVVSPTKTPQGHFRFSFQDLAFLRATTTLESPSLSVRRLWRALRATRAALPPERPLSSVRVVAVTDRVLVKENNTSWDPESRQTLFAFAVTDADAYSPDAEQQRSPARIVTTHTGEYWFERGLRLDRGGDGDQAIRAYRKAIEIDPKQVDARINLGRLLHGEQRYREAETLYREALAHDTNHPIAAFNLGVVLEDQGALDAAIDSYQIALAADSSLPDAHYNLARLYGWRGDRELAARHLARFRALLNDEA